MKHLSWQAKALIVSVILIVLLKLAIVINSFPVYNLVGNPDKNAIEQLNSTQSGNKLLTVLLTITIISAVVFAVLEYARAMRKK